MYDPIIDALRRNATGEALAAAQQLVAERPQDPAARRLLAAAHRQDGDAVAALAAIDEAIRLSPEEAGLHLDRAGLLLQERRMEEAKPSVARAITLDPNHFAAYILQAQMALDAGELDEAERVAKVVTRLAPKHPEIPILQSAVAMRRGNADAALTILNQAIERLPNEPRLKYALGSAYMAQGHFAFAEQAFRSLLAHQPDSLPVSAVMAEMMQKQGRPAEAAAELARYLDKMKVPEPTLQRTIGELELEAGNNERALPLLRAALGAMPGDTRALTALVEAWKRLDAAEDARRTLDAALATHSQESGLWRARLLFEPFASADASAVIDRWLQAMPDHVLALEAQSTVYVHAGDTEAAEAVARRIVAIEPGRTDAELFLVQRLVERDPAAAVKRLQELLDGGVPNDRVRMGLLQLQARAHDAAGDPAAAVALWNQVNAGLAPHRVPLVDASRARQQWPERAERAADASEVFLMWGAPGSQVERVVLTLNANPTRLCLDRFSPQSPQDLFQSYGNVEDQITVDQATTLAGQWRSLLAQRAPDGDGVQVDWLPWWDNAMLLAMRPALPEGTLLVVLRDPRDMLVDWMEWGATGGFRLETPEAGARWLAGQLEHIATLHEQDLYSHRLLRLDEVVNDAARLAARLGTVLGREIVPADKAVFEPPRFPGGHWRRYAQVLAEPFALLTPAAVRLGYPES